MHCHWFGNLTLADDMAGVCQVLERETSAGAGLDERRFLICRAAREIV